MKNLQTKTKAELIEIIESMPKQGDNVAEFVEHLKNMFICYQSGVFSKYEILNIIKDVYDAFIRKE